MLHRGFSQSLPHSFPLALSLECSVCHATAVCADFYLYDLSLGLCHLVKTCCSRFFNFLKCWSGLDYLSKIGPVEPEEPPEWFRCDEM